MNRNVWNSKRIDGRAPRRCCTRVAILVSILVSCGTCVSAPERDEIVRATFEYQLAHIPDNFADLDEVDFCLAVWQVEADAFADPVDSVMRGLAGIERVHTLSQCEKGWGAEWVRSDSSKVIGRVQLGFIRFADSEEDTASVIAEYRQSFELQVRYSYDLKRGPRGWEVVVAHLKWES